jgi:hypothetical protein
MEVESRRDFLKFLGMLGGAFYAEGLLAAAGTDKNEVLLINNSTKAGYGKPWMTVRTPPGSVRIFSLASGKTEEVQLPFFGHNLDQNPRQHHVAATFEQFGRRGAAIDLKARKVLAEIETVEGNTFIGHSAYSPDKQWIYTTEQNHRTNQGEISVRDSVTFKFIQKFPSYGHFPHDCRLIEGGSKLIVANNRGPSNIAYIETSSGKLLHQVIAGSSELVLSHFDISYDQWLFAGPRDKSPYGVLVSPGGQRFQLPHPKIEKTGILSVKFITGSDFLGATYPEGNLVQMWNYKTQKQVASIELPNPRGILEGQAGKSILVSLAEERVLKELTQNPKSLAAKNFGHGFGGSGSHLVRLSLT